jgi:hypothetical protein
MGLIGSCVSVVRVDGVLGNALIMCLLSGCCEGP